MKLWIFVLLGLLAQTSQGNFLCSYDSIAKNLESVLTSAIFGCNGLIFRGINILSLLNRKVHILDIVSVTPSCIHKGGGQFEATITATFFTGCEGFSNAKLAVTIKLIISHIIKGGNPCYEMDKGSVSITVKDTEGVKVIDVGGLGGGLLGNALGLVAGLLNTVTSILTGTITNAIEFSLIGLNNKLQLLTQTGEDIKCEVAGITHGISGFTYELSYTLPKTGETIISTASQITSALAAGVSSILRLPGSFFSFFFGALFSGYTKTIDGAIIRNHNLFPGSTGNFELGITLSSSRCTTSSAGAVLSATLAVIIKNPAGEQVVELVIIVNYSFTVQRSRGLYNINFTDLLEIVTITVESTHTSCGCDDHDKLIESIREIITFHINSAFIEIKCTFKHTPIPGTGYYGNSEGGDYECPCDDDGFYCTS